MKRAVLIASCFFVLLNVGNAQLATDPNEGLWIKQDAPGIFTMRWYGRLGRTYFVQQSFDLQTWTYRTDAQSIEPGLDLVIPYGFTASSDKYFVRLKYPQPDIPTDDPLGDDFDGDGVSNANELQAGMDPLRFTDSNGNGLSDDWEMFYFGNLTHLAGTIEDGGTLTNKEQSELGLNPTINEAATSALRLNYTYDAVGRLTGTTGVATSLTYTVDAEGNITNAQ